jgi:hypothetical protein
MLGNSRKLYGQRLYRINIICTAAEIYYLGIKVTHDDFLENYLT